MMFFSVEITLNYALPPLLSVVKWQQQKWG